MRNKRVVTALLTAAMSVSLAACGNSSKGTKDGCGPVKVVLPTAVSGTALESKYLEQWMEDVTERSNGQITFDYTNGGALGSFDELLEGTDSGVYDMSLITLSYYETYVPEAEILSFPFLMMDYDDAHDVLDGEIGDWLKEKTLANTNTGWMGYLMCYFRYINSSTPIETLDDCKDVLIRVPTTQTTIDTFDKMGFSTVPLPFADIYTAMSTGVVNAVETSGESIYNYGFCDFAKYVCKSNHQPIIESVIYNQDFWNSLPEEYQQIMTDAMNDMLVEEWKASQENEAVFCDLLEKEKGVTVTEFNDDAKAQLKEMFKDYWSEKAEAISPEMTEKLNAAIEIVNNN